MIDRIDAHFIDEDKTDTGLARRMIDLKRWDAHTVVGWLEDDFHHFGVTLEHSGELITGVSATAQRYPWATCAFAPEALAPLVGQSLRPRSSDIGALIEMRQQCTHIFDLAGLTMAHAVRGSSHRRYQTITDSRKILGWKDHKSPQFGPTTIRLLLDNQEVMQWYCDSGTILDRESGHQQSLGRGFREWTESLPIDKAEYATVLRRALLVSGGRSMIHDNYPSAAAMDQPELCYSFQASRRDTALRMHDTTKDYADHPEAMLAFVDKRP
ncbi:DUF2889 domain-containing protein [Spongiibacter nanhainus]|uniref:DUF2889 domain-containing protein n=1 Tax=Spongiibacter nanhainus TaxID=2794344 RepID=A0A7T4UP61_9GAMM|nr:DUF2889 domain-containing protein [Spongiibacter nanhainus]QQD17328.1 DUF2889 domain-containing protein [Spongiibacter nanhainus]